MARRPRRHPRSTGYIAAKIRAHSARNNGRMRKNPEDYRRQLVALSMSGPEGTEQARELANALGIILTEDGVPQDMRGVDLSGADLVGGYLDGVDFRGANLSGADLRGADLRGADLRGANLRGATLRDAYLSEANLSEADLRGADLNGADLWRADLIEADLRNADLSRADLSGIKYDEYTEWPNGFTPPSSR